MKVVALIEDPVELRKIVVWAQEQQTDELSRARSTPIAVKALSQWIIQNSYLPSAWRGCEEKQQRGSACILAHRKARMQAHFFYSFFKSASMA
jgi:hypothetical protein